MPAPNWLDWTLWGLAVALWAAAVLLACLAVFRDRARGRRRCPCCWYGMDGVPGLTCPECGRTARGERALFRTRRHWRRVGVAACIAAAGYGAWVTPQVRRDGWISAVPNSALVVIAPMGTKHWQWVRIDIGEPPLLGIPRHPLLAEAAKRLREKRLSSWQSQILLDRFFAEHPKQLGQLIQTRDHWPVGEPVKYHLEEAWLTDPLMVVVRARMASRAGSDANAWMYNWPPFGFDSPLQFLPDAGAQEAEIELEVWSGLVFDREAGHPAGTHRVWRGRKVVSIGGGRADVMTAVRSEAADQGIERRLSPRLVRLRDGRVSLHINSTEDQWQRDDLAVGMRIAVLKDGDAVAEGRASHRLRRRTFAFLSNPSTLRGSVIPLEWSCPPPTAATLKDHAWEIRVRGDVDTAFELYLLATDYWDGEFTVPVRTIRDWR